MHSGGIRYPEWTAEGRPLLISPLGAAIKNRGKKLSKRYKDMSVLGPSQVDDAMKRNELAANFKHINVLL